MNDQRKETLSNFHSYKIVVLGSGAVGKSCLTCKFIMNSFNEEYIPTLQDTFRKNFQVDGKIASIGKLSPFRMRPTRAHSFPALVLRRHRSAPHLPFSDARNGCRPRHSLARPLFSPF